MRTLIKRSLYGIAVLTLCIGPFYAFKCEERPAFLRPFVRVYFDKSYYLKTYPEVEKMGMDPFEHYMSIGWREGKNPTSDFETTFYKRFYFEGHEHRFGLNPLEHHLRALLHFRTEPIRESQVNKKAVPLKNPKYYLTLVAVFRDEAPYLKEWIEFYRLMGVEHFYLFNHLSQDYYKEILAPYIKEGIVELEDVTGEPKNQKEWDCLQNSLYEKITERIASYVEWLVVVDTDEFLYPIKDNTLSEALRAYDDAVCVSVPWQLFGSGQVEKLQPNELLIEKLTKAHPNGDSRVKSIVKPRYAVSFNTSHFANVKDGYAQITEERHYFKGMVAPAASYNVFKLNHYWARDWDFFRKKKLSRVHIIGKGLTFEEYQEKLKIQLTKNYQSSNKPEADILRFVPQLKKRMGLT